MSDSGADHGSELAESALAAVREDDAGAASRALTKSIPDVALGTTICW